MIMNENIKTQTDDVINNVIYILIYLCIYFIDDTI